MIIANGLWVTTNEPSFFCHNRADNSYNTFQQNLMLRLQNGIANEKRYGYCIYF